MKKLFTLFSAMAFTSAVFAQIPNPGFETWVAVSGGVNPTGWDSPNSLTGIASVYTCDSGMDAPPQGVAYIKLTTKAITLPPATVPGVAVTGSISVSGSSYSVSGGFPYTTRAMSLTGQWQYMPQGSDKPRIGAFLFKWNTTTSKRDTVALLDTTISGIAMAWAPFTLPFKYYSGQNPDSGIVILSSSASTSAVVGSYLYADDVAFAGTVPNGIVTVGNESPSTTIYPNPASNTATLFYHSTTTRDVQVGINDVSGRTVKTINSTIYRGENNVTLDLHGLAQGIYFVKISDGENTVEQKLIVF
jgi:hypothetical protein